MKKCMAMFLAACLIFSLAACVKEGRAEPTDSVSTTRLTSVEAEKPGEDIELKQLEGIYRPENNDDTYEKRLQIYNLNDTLLLEQSYWMDGELIETLAEEFWLHEDGISGSSVTGLAQTFGQNDSYQAAALERTILLTDEGLVLRSEEGEENFVRDESIAGAHNDYTTYLVGEIDSQLCGAWESYGMGYAAAVVFEPSGYCRIVVKQRNTPCFLFEGAWCVEDDILRCNGEQIVGGTQHMEYGFSYEWNENGELLLYAQTEGTVALMGGAFCFRPSEGDWMIGMPQTQAVGYFTQMYDVCGEYTDDLGNLYGYDYRVPQLLSEKPGAQELNAELQDIFGSIAQEELASIGEGASIHCESIRWFATHYDGLLFLVLSARSVYGYESYAAFCYEPATDTRLNNSELIARMGLSESEYLEAFRAAAEASLRNSFGGMSQEDWEMYGCEELLQWTVSDEAVHMDRPVYVDDFGNLVVAAQIGSIAGASYYERLIYPLGESVG